MTDKVLQYLFLAVLGLIAAVFVTPIVATTVLVNKSSSMMDKLANSIDKSISPQIGAGGSAALLERRLQELTDMAALPGEAARNSEKVHVALVSFFLPSPIAQDKSKVQHTFIPVTLSIGDLSSAAALMMASGPVLWRLDGQHLSQRGKLAFEGRAPFNIKNSQQGLIAGIKIQGMGTYAASAPHSFDDDRRGFCQSMSAWADFFELSRSNITIWRVELPLEGPNLIADDYGFKAPDGVVGELGTASGLCQ